MRNPPADFISGQRQNFELRHHSEVLSWDVSHHVPVQVEFLQPPVGGQCLPVVLAERDQAPFQHHLSGWGAASTGQGVHPGGLLRVC